VYECATGHGKTVLHYCLDSTTILSILGSHRCSLRGTQGSGLSTSTQGVHTGDDAWAFHKDAWAFQYEGSMREGKT